MDKIYCPDCNTELIVCYQHYVFALLKCLICRENYEAIIWKGECLSVLTRKRLSRNKDGKRRIY